MKYLKVFIWPIIFMIGQFIIQYLFTFYFNNKYYSNKNLYDIINTYEYQNKLNNYINNHILLILLITTIIFIPILYKVFKKYKSCEKIKFDKFYIILGICVALTYNLYLSFIIPYQVSNLPLYVQIISSGIIGPILEELLFRGIVYNKLKEFNKVSTAMIISTIIFSLMHFSLIDSIYTLFMGHLLVYVYEKYKNLKYSMIVHIFSNVSVIIIGLVIVWNNLILNLSLFVIYLITILFMYYKRIISTK